MTDPNKPTPDDSQLGRFAQAWANSHGQVRLYVESVVWNRTDAEDVTQEIAFKAGRGFHTFDPSRPFIAWVMGIARNEIKMYLRNKHYDIFEMFRRGEFTVSPNCIKKHSAGISRN